MALTPAEIRARVIREISDFSGHPVDIVEQLQKLKTALGFTREMLRALSAPFERIARESNPNAQITMAVCEKLKTVNEADALVQAKSKGELA